MRMRNYLLVITLVATTAPLAAQQGAPATPPARPIPAPLGYDSLAFGRRLTGWLIAGEVDSLWANTSMPTRLEWGGENRWTEIVAQFKAQLGQGKVERVDERWARRGKEQYWFVANVAGVTREPYVLRWVLDPTGVSALGIMPYPEAGPSTQIAP
jgi:hypothetical protein